MSSTAREGSSPSRPCSTGTGTSSARSRAAPRTISATSSRQSGMVGGAISTPTSARTASVFRLAENRPRSRVSVLVLVLGISGTPSGSHYGSEECPEKTSSEGAGWSTAALEQQRQMALASGLLIWTALIPRIGGG